MDCKKEESCCDRFPPLGLRTLRALPAKSLEMFEISTRFISQHGLLGSQASCRYVLPKRHWLPEPSKVDEWKAGIRRLPRSDSRSFCFLHIFLSLLHALGIFIMQSCTWHELLKIHNEGPMPWTSFKMHKNG